MTKRSASGYDWTNLSFIVGYHAALAIGLPFYFYYSTPSASMIVASVVLLFLTEIGIGAAYHRFYSHRAYKPSRPVEAVLLFLATMTFQGSAIQWSHDHRLHHRFVDTDRDPYSIKKGFWYAHILWIFEKAPPLDERLVPDLMKNRLAVFQHRHAGLLGFASNALVCGILGWALGDFLGAFVLAWWTRLFFSHHLTWFINSLAHCWGSKSFSREHSAVDNFLVAFLTVGEGYHNYHHTFASDYRNGVRWYHFDPTKWTIWTLSKLGLATDLKRYSHSRIKKRLLAEDRKMLLANLKQQALQKKQGLEQRVEQLASCIQEKLTRMGELVDQVKRVKREGHGRSTVKALRAELRELKRSVKQDWKDWSDLCGLVLDPAAA